MSIVIALLALGVIAGFFVMVVPTEASEEFCLGLMFIAFFLGFGYLMFKA